MTNVKKKKGPKPEYLLSTYSTWEHNYTTNSASAHLRAYIIFLPQGKYKNNIWICTKQAENTMLNWKTDS